MKKAWAFFSLQNTPAYSQNKTCVLITSSHSEFLRNANTVIVYSCLYNAAKKDRRTFFCLPKHINLFIPWMRDVSQLQAAELKKPYHLRNCHDFLLSSKTHYLILRMRHVSQLQAAIVSGTNRTGSDCEQWLHVALHYTVSNRRGIPNSSFRGLVR